MSDTVSEGTSQTDSVENQPVNEQPTHDPTEYSSLARMRAAQQESAPAPTTPNAGTSTPGGQQAPTQEQNERSQYIPRERFDQVNEKLREAQAQLAMQRSPTGMQPVGNPVPQQQQNLTQGGMVIPQQQGQAVANSPQVRGLLDSISDKEEQEKWRKKIANAPITGLAEFIQYAIQTEGAALLQQSLAPLQAQIAPLQQSFAVQQVSNYVAQREQVGDPTWAQVEPHFYQLASQAAQEGYPLTPDTLSVVEAVARQNAGVPMFGAPQVPQTQAPFTERPGSGGQNFGSTPQVQLTPQQQAMAKRFDMTPEEYAADLGLIQGARR